MAGIIGAASDFYRLRVVRVDEGGTPDLEWREDILYRRAPTDHPDEFEVYRVEAVGIDDTVSHTLSDFREPEDAYTFLDAASEDLSSLTKSRFDERYGIEG